MWISIVLAWISVLLCVLTAFKVIARISGNKALNRVFGKIHIPFGILLLITGTLHGIFAGNPATATLANFKPAAVLFSLNWGTACLILIILLACTYLFRRQLKKKWMFFHRIASVALIVCLILHLKEVGITLPSLLFPEKETIETTTEQNNNEAEVAAMSETAQSNEALILPETSEREAMKKEVDEEMLSTDSIASSENMSSNESVLSKEDKEKSAQAKETVLQDGRYEGTADGYKGKIKVAVIVESGKILEIEVLESEDTNRYFAQAEAVIGNMLEEQSTKVDVVSGATYSSNGIIDAVQNALENATKK